MAAKRNPLDALRLLNPEPLEYLLRSGNPAPNPATSVGAAVARRYRNFHEVDPHTVTEKTCWVPGELVLLGRGLRIDYKANVPDGAKGNGQEYTHEFESGVKLYRRAQRGEQPDVVWRNFPSELMVLGYALDFEFEDPEDGEAYTTSPAKTDKLMCSPDGKTLAIVGSNGVKFVAKGGRLKVTDWIYH